MSDQQHPHHQYLDAFAFQHASAPQSPPAPTPLQGQHSHQATYHPTASTSQQQQHGGLGQYRHASGSSSRLHPADGPGPSPSQHPQSSHGHGHSHQMLPPLTASYTGYANYYDYPETYVSPPQQHPADPSPPILPYQDQLSSGYALPSPHALNPPNFAVDRYGPSGTDGRSKDSWTSARVQGASAAPGRSYTPVGTRRDMAGTPSDHGSAKAKGKARHSGSMSREENRAPSRTSGVGTMGPPMTQAPAPIQLQQPGQAAAPGSNVERDMLLLQGYLNEIITLLPPFCTSSSAADTPNADSEPIPLVPSNRSNPSMRQPPPKPPKYLLARFARLSTQIKSTLLTLGPHVSLAPDFDPIPKRTERKMTRAEEEMEKIRRRRDALLTKAREQSMMAGASGSALGQGSGASPGQGPGQGSAGESRNGSRSGSVVHPAPGRNASAPPPGAEPDLSGLLGFESRDDRAPTIPAPSAGHVRRESDSMFVASSDWPLPMRDYMPTATTPVGYGGMPGMDSGLNFTDRLPDLDFTGAGNDYGRLPMSMDMVPHGRDGRHHHGQASGSNGNGHSHDSTDMSSLPPFTFGIGPGSAMTHGSGSSHIPSDPPSATVSHATVGVNGSTSFDMGQMGDLAFPPHTPTDFGDMTAGQTRENMAWLARNSTQPPQPTMQSQTNGMMDRCHGCGVITGEWMVGPDGPGSLCVSCGSHYAKLAKRRTNASQEEQSNSHSVST